jgi:chloramphenicol-sensitive protein RarD
MNKGTLHALGAYLLWGFLPIYWKAIHNVSAPQILTNRIVWSFAMLAIIITLRKDWPVLRQAVSNRRTLGMFFIASCLLSVNWLTYIWGVNAGFIVETSLGYFINPLISVLLGVVFLREKLRPWQWLPVGLAGAGVAYLTLSYGQLPWIALVLAFTFGLYGLVKKTAPLGSLHSVSLETAILFLPCLGYLWMAERAGTGALGHSSALTNLLLVGTGVATSTPLLMFGAAARRIPLSTLGILQYIAPTCQFLLGTLVYNEPFTMSNLVGFVLIWTALLVYTLEGVLVRRKTALAAAGL